MIETKPGRPAGGPQARLLLRHYLRIMQRDPVPVIAYILSPLLLMAVMKGSFKYVLIADGNVSATGAEQAVPGMAVSFSFFVVSSVGFAFFREFEWHTWDRIRTMGMSRSRMLGGKILGPMCFALIQSTFIFVVGIAFLGLEVKGPMIGLVATIVTSALFVSALGLALVRLCHSLMQLNVMSNLLVMIFAGLGGALAPFSTLPGWAQTIGRLSPAYWEMRSYTNVINGGDSTWPYSVGLLLVIAALLAWFGAGLAESENRHSL